MRITIEVKTVIAIREEDNKRCATSCPKFVIGETDPLSNTEESDYCSQFSCYLEGYERCEECLKAKVV